MNASISCFSPTGGGEKVAQAIRRGLEGCAPCSDVEPRIFAVPVYGGHMPALAKKRFDLVRATADGQPAILVAVYGNRAFEHALTDLETFVRERGFRPIATAAFVCEHSYSTPDTPIAAGRPDADDLQAAEQFGRLVGQKLLAGDPASVRAADLQDEPSPEASVKRFAAFVREFSARQAASPRPFVPEYRADLCSGCGACIAACPAEAIGSDYAIDPARCIACCACVKACPVQARRFLSPFARPLAENFSLRKSPRWVV